MKIGREFHNNINSHNSFVFPLLFVLKQDQKQNKKIKREQKTAKEKKSLQQQKKNMNKMINQRASFKFEKEIYNLMTLRRNRYFNIIF